MPKRLLRAPLQLKIKGHEGVQLVHDSIPCEVEAGGGDVKHADQIVVVGGKKVQPSLCLINL